MKRKELESRLSSLNVDFAAPKIEFEQYATQPTIASDILLAAAYEYDDIEDALVVDLGSGAGVLSAASLYVCNLISEKVVYEVQCGAGGVIGIEIDNDAIDLNIQNRGHPDFEESIWDIVQQNVTALSDHAGRFQKIADCVITNPPFGTRAEGIDFTFIKAAKNISKSVIYSLHKSSCRNGSD